MTFAEFTSPPPGSVGFKVLAGRTQGLKRVMWVAGRLPVGDVGPVHAHEGDEVLRVVSGEVLIRCGDEEQLCRAGQLVVVPPGMLHGFRVVRETVLEVVAEYDIGTLYPVRADTGKVELVEVHRADMPWGRPPPAGQDWTSDEDMQRILDQLADHDS
jgi:mannose-6-phosphate isomerase-like protein (cupin superfamily)